MEETSVGVAAGAAVASLGDWIDLDGNLLLASEPFEGLELGDDCRWQLGTEPGLGVRRRVAEKGVAALGAVGAESTLREVGVGDDAPGRAGASLLDHQVA
jgi:hypothetical protein